MSTLTSVMARTYSRLGQRGAIFGMAVIDAAKEDEKFILLTADLATLSGMDRYTKTYPEQFINVGIAEQNMIGMAAGLAAEGFHPCATTYATFICMRSCEQIRHYLGYMAQKVIVVGSGAGLCQGFAGNTHYTIEDISVLRAIPNISIVSPADAGSAVKLFEEARKAKKSVYMRLTGNLNCPIIYKNDREFPIGGSVTLREGNDITIFACGTMVSTALNAADLLFKQNINASVVDIYSIKPIDENAVLNSKTSKLLVTVEEHSILGGLGGAVAEVISNKSNMPRLFRCGINDMFNLAGDYEDLLSQNHLTPELLAKDILNEYKNI